MNTEPINQKDLGALIADLTGELTQARARVQLLEARMSIFHRLINEYGLLKAGQK